MDCRYKGRYVVFLYMSFCSKKLSVDEDVCVLIFATFRPNIGPILYSCPHQNSILPKCNKIKQKAPDQKGVIFNGETLPSSIQIDLCLCLFNHSPPSSISSAIVRAVSLIFNFSIFSSRHSLLMVAADLPGLHYVNLPALYKQSTIYSIYTIHIMSTCLLCIYRVQTSKRSVGFTCP